jgi:CheY-like chemotaxis protein
MEKQDSDDPGLGGLGGMERSGGSAEPDLGGAGVEQGTSAEIARIQRRLAVLDEAVRSSGPVFNEAQNERGQLRLQLEVLQRAELVGQLVATRHELNDLQQAHERLTATLATLQAEREGLCREVGEWRGRAETQNVELERLRKLSDGRIAEQIQELTTQLNELETELRHERYPAQGGDIAPGNGDPQLGERNRQLQARLADAEAECAALRERVATLQTLREGLDRECDKLRARLASAVESERYRDEATHLRGQVEDLQREQREAAQRHSTAVGGYMLELNQRSELLRQREAEVQQLTHELSLARSAREEAITQLTSLRAEREILALRVREVEAARLRRRNESAEAASDAAPAAPAAAAGVKEAAKKPTPAPARPAQTPVSEPALTPPPVDQPLIVLHLESDEARQKAVRDAVAKIEKVEYSLPSQLESQPLAGTGLLVVNLAREAAPALTALSEPQKWGLDRARAFTYCEAGGSGFILGMVDFFPHPFSVDTCAAQLTRRGNLRRLLAVSDDVDATSSVREVLGRLGCSTATAFDARQAADLLPLIKPDVVLIDLSMARGEGLRSVSRLGADPATAKVSVAMFWSKPVPASDVTKSVSLAIRENNQPFPNLGFEFERFLTELRGRGSIKEAERAAG